MVVADGVRSGAMALPKTWFGSDCENVSSQGDFGRQRDPSENTNGLLRQYMPKGTDLSEYSKADLNNKIQRSLNGRLRKTLGYKTSVEKLAECVALST
ncbi:hypothetical protein FEAC_11060 [Ferrimicrobium acidiphilum DSM 19497]|uniref:Integrase catalytic domain-containing protein n=1 Tax=Ferrimicrobium acidiphilum DSM 19497 TaxID=1121877 RepID=A0A0D8FV53_9ACTN|nr:hypothetical protein FEAC_11060 [Ferrimicrobium acidiphilum DSM 19497]